MPVSGRIPRPRLGLIFARVAVHGSRYANSWRPVRPIHGARVGTERVGTLAPKSTAMPYVALRESASARPAPSMAHLAPPSVAATRPGAGAALRPSMGYSARPAIAGRRRRPSLGWPLRGRAGLSGRHPWRPLLSASRREFWRSHWRLGARRIWFSDAPECPRI